MGEDGEANSVTLREGLVLGTLLVVYGNLLAMAASRFDAGILPGLANMVLLAGLLGYVLWVKRQPLSAIGLTTNNLPLSLAAGFGVGALMALPALVFFAFPVVSEQPVREATIAALSLPEYVYRVTVHALVVTALVEEVAFRGVLQWRLVSALGTRQGILVGSGFFALWHVVVNAQTAQSTNLPSSPEFVALSFAGSLASVFVGGLLFAVLRQHTGNLASAIAAHWVVVAIMVTALFLAG